MVGILWCLIREVCVDLSTCFKSIHHWHVDVQDYNVEVVFRFRFNDLHRLQAVIRSRQIEIRCELSLVRHLDKGFVIDEEHSEQMYVDRRPLIFRCAGSFTLLAKNAWLLMEDWSY